MDDEAMIALLQATYDSSQALVRQHEADQRRTEQELAVLRTERDLLLRRVATLEAAHDELQRTRAQLGDALRRAAHAEQRAEVLRGRVGVRMAKAVVRRLAAAGGRGNGAAPTSVGGTGLVRERGTGLVLVDIVGWPTAAVPGLLDHLAARRNADGTVLVLLTDSERFELLRAHGFAFEYLSGGGVTRDERIAELSAAYRVDRVVVAADDDELTALVDPDTTAVTDADPQAATRESGTHQGTTRDGDAATRDSAVVAVTERVPA